MFQKSSDLLSIKRVSQENMQSWAIPMITEFSTKTTHGGNQAPLESASGFLSS